jgi:hypothetical protein
VRRSFSVDRFHDWWFQFMLNAFYCCCACILRWSAHIIYLHLKLWWLLCGRNWLMKVN